MDCKEAKKHSTKDAVLIKLIDARLKEEGYGPHDEARKVIFRFLGLTMTGFTDDSINLPDGAILIGAHKGEVLQATAREGLLWVNGNLRGFQSLSGAAFYLTANRTLSGYQLFDQVLLPGTGFVPLKSLRKENKIAVS